GFREIFANIARKKTNIILQKGYISRFGNATELTGALPKVLLDKNETLDAIQSFVKQNKMKVVFYCAPFCKNNQNKDFTTKLKVKIPELKDFSQALSNDQFFMDCNHLNDKGAKRFTEIFSEEVLMK
ncbi:MAG: hypothetical protein H7Z76_08150, partial [Methylotenera sp.]|nr:hypothetical protein [Flavobacterium sp.]